MAKPLRELCLDRALMRCVPLMNPLTKHLPRLLFRSVLRPTQKWCSLLLLRIMATLRLLLLLACPTTTGQLRARVKLSSACMLAIGLDRLGIGGIPVCKVIWWVATPLFKLISVARRGFI